MMADSRNDSTGFNRSSLSPSKKEAHREKANEYRIMTSRSTDDRKSSNLGIEIYPSPTSKTTSPRKSPIMTEKEVSSLVHNALIRARQATKSFSPRNRNLTSQSPRSTDALSIASTQSNRPIVPTLSTSSPSNEGRPPIHASHYSASYFRSPVSNVSQGGRGGGSVCSDEFHTPKSTTSIDASESRVSSRTNLILQKLKTNTEERATMQSERKSLEIYASNTGDQSTLSGESANSSDDIIRRVEEEIANARKAAQEATRRLAGVSANFMAEVGNGSRSPRSPRSQTGFGVVSKGSSIEREEDGPDIGLPETIEKEINRSSSTDEDGNFVSALDLIGEEFDEIIACRSEAIDSKKIDMFKRSSKIELANSYSTKDEYCDEMQELSITKTQTPSGVDIVAPQTHSEGFDDYNKIDEEEKSTIDCIGKEVANSKSVEEKKEDDINKCLSSPPSGGAFENRVYCDDQNETSVKECIPDIADMTNKRPYKSERFSRTRSIEECSLDYVLADERKEMLTEGSEQVESETKALSELKTVVSINKSTDDVPLDELEAVLSDEREADKTASGFIESSFEPDEQVEQQDQVEQVNSSECISETEESTTENRTLENALNDQATSTNTRCRDKNDLLPEISKKSSKDLTALERNLCQELDDPIENIENSSHSKETMEFKTANDSTTKNSLGVSKTQPGYDKSKEQQDSGSLTSKIENSVKNTPGEEEKISGIDDNAVPEEDHGLTDSPIDNECHLSDTTSKGVEENEAVDKNSEHALSVVNNASSFDDQATEVIDNRDLLVNNLLENLSFARNENIPPNDLRQTLDQRASGSTKSPSEEHKGSKDTTADSVDQIDASCRGKKVKFKQRYPIPQKMKKFRQPSEILFDFQPEKPSNKLWLSMPKKDLKELLEAVTGASIQRRNNACGALKVLSTQKKNQMTLVRTQGFLDALVSTISDNYSTEDSEAGIAARTRAVNVILNVSTKKDNRYHVMMHPGLKESLVRCLIEDKAEGRELTCALLATLAKSQHCREPMAKTEKLVDTLATIMKGNVSSTFNFDPQVRVEEEKIDYSGDDENSRDSSKSFSSSSSSSSSNSSFGEDSVETQEEDAEMIMRTRMNACAALLHLSKECSISQDLCASETLLDSLVSCCNEVQNPIHTKCLEIFANLSRFPQNNAHLVAYPDVVDSLLVNGAREDEIDRLWSMRIFQNLSSEPSAKATLATTSILELLSTNMMRTQYEEQLAATSTIYNISTEPGAVVPLTNTKNVVATLVHVAHSPTSVMEVRTIACDALATLGLWLQTLASAGTVPEGVKSVSLPTYITSGWHRWED